MPERQEMLGGQRAAEKIVVGAGRQADPWDVLNRQDQGDALAADLAQLRTVAFSRGGHDDRVDPAAQ